MAATAVGAYLAGVLPHRTLGGRAAQPAGLNVADMFAARLKSYILLGAIEPRSTSPRRRRSTR